MRERRHNQPIDIGFTGVARARHEYDPAVQIVPPKVYRDVMGPSDLWTRSDKPGAVTYTAQKAMTVVANSQPINLSTGDSIQFEYKVQLDGNKTITTEPLLVNRGQIEKITQFREPQTNGAILNRFEVSYWCELGAPQADPGQKMLLVERGKDSYVSFMVYSYSVSITKDSNEAFIQAWGYS